MKYCRYLAVALLCTISFCASAQELPPNPRLLLDQKDIDILKKKIAGPFASQWNSFRAGVDKSLDDPIDLPPRGGNWSHNYVCPEHGARLKQGKKIGPWEWEHICPVGPHTLHGDPSKGTTDFDGNGIMGVHLSYADQIVGLGVVYQVSGDEKYAKRSREILLAYADKYLTYPLHDNQGKPGSGGHVASQSLTEASWLIQMAQGADLVWQTLSEADRKTIADKLLRPALADCILPKHYGIHNIQCRQNSAIGLVGFLLNDGELIHTAIDDPKEGFRTQIAKGVHDDGMWLEGASGYHFFTIDGLWPLAEAARHCGIDLYDAKFKSMFDGPLRLAMPDLRLPNFNDSGIVDLTERADSYDLAYARWHDPAYPALALKDQRRGRFALLYGDVDLVSAKPAITQGASRNLTESGYAILQSGDSDDTSWLCIKYDPFGGGHGHLDKNHFILWSRGSIVMPDAGTHAYGSPLHGSWDKTSLAHNTLTVDEKSQEPSEGKCIAFGTTDGIHYAMTDAGPIYKEANIRFVRTATMINPNLIIVIDQIHADAEHTYDLAVHLSGKWDSSLLTPSPGTPGEGQGAGSPWTASKSVGYSVLKDLTSRNSTETTSLRTMFGKDRSATLTLVGTDPTEIITGTGVGESTRDRIPIALFRRHAKSTAYVWAISLDGKQPSIHMLALTAAEKPVDPSDAMGAQIETAQGDIQLLANPEGLSLVAKSLGWNTSTPFSVRMGRKP